VTSSEIALRDHLERIARLRGVPLARAMMESLRTDLKTIALYAAIQGDRIASETT
jgi:hypothetical protein